MQLIIRHLIKPLPARHRRQHLPHGAVLQGNCIEVMGDMASGSVDFVLTDPPYMARYRDRSGRRIIGDDTAEWLPPAFAEIYRLLKPDSFCVSFYGWNRADRFIEAWRAAGFRLVGHLVFRKHYASKVSFTRRIHESAYLLAKGNPPPPPLPIPDVLDWRYTGNHLHPTQKPIEALTPLIESFSRSGDLVLDPFCGSGSTLLAAHRLGRAYLGIEIDPVHHRTAMDRLQAAG